MDEIVQLLQNNARLTAEDISAMTKKSVEEVKDIIKKLEDEGVILKYAAIVNPEKLSENKEKVRAEIEIQVVPEREHGFDALADRIYRFPQVKSLYLMSVARKLATLHGVKSTKTHFVLKTYKENDVLYVDEKKDRREGVTA